MDIFTLQARYIHSCRRNEVPPNSAVLSWFFKADIQKSCQENSCIVILLNQLKDDDLLPLIDVFMAIDSFDIDVVDVLHESPCNLNEQLLISLLRAIDLKLRVVDLHNITLKEDFVRDLCRHGLACKVLNLRSTHIRKLNMAGRFMRLQTLNLDFCSSITSLHEDCFSCMPNLMCVSMCETRVADLWTTTAALSKLPSLVELRFQNCLCCKDTGPCPASVGKKENSALATLGSAHSNTDLTPKILPDSTELDPIQASRDDELCSELFSAEKTFTIKKGYGGVDKLTFASEAKISSCLHRIGLLVLSPSVLPDHNNSEMKLRNENYNSHHPSPICFEKHYREYLIASLPHLEVLDNLSIGDIDREMANIVFSEYFERSPYSRPQKKKIVSILQSREIRAAGAGAYWLNFSNPKQKHLCGKSPSFFARSLSATKLMSVGWPLLHPLSNFSQIHKEGNKRLRPRQFEYHPSDSRLMVFGTLDGEVVIINNENGKVVGYVPSTGAMNSILGLCWLKMHPSKVLAGSDNGCLKLFDINHMPPKVADLNYTTGVVCFDDFEPLTSVHVNATDDQFIASGYSKDVALYDINSQRRIQLFTNMHREPINVAKFAHHSPFIFATSSFDQDTKLWDLRQKPEQPCYIASSSRGNVMVCFSPDDQYLLVSAVDNEVKQLLAVDGRVHMNFEIASTGSGHNYTRSYYINGGDYIISGSCDENVVHVCCARTGRRLKNVYLEDSESGNSLFVQSLRGDPYRPFHMSVLTASKRPTSKCEIIKVNLLSCNYSA
ncbi:Protein DWD HYPERSENSITIVE TO UV-B 1 [Euphorbia peplus]|nr:Protein DWD HYPERSENSITIVE TO UV-B 1 [Euphorbia peplus]